MTLDKTHRIRLLILFIITLVSILLLAISFWNQGNNQNISLNVWPLIYLIIALFCCTSLFITIRKISNPALIQSQIKEEVALARTKILAEFKSNEEEVINKSADIDERLSKIIPKGKFKTPKSFADKLLANLSKELQASLGMFFIEKDKKYSFLSGFALSEEQYPPDFKSGENLNGQVAETKEVLILPEIPEEYFFIESGLGKSKPKTLIIVPVLHNRKAIGIIEFATFIKDDDESMVDLLTKVGISAGEKLVLIQKS